MTFDAISGVLPVLLIIVSGAFALVLVNQKTLRLSRDDQEKRIAILEGQSQRDKETIEGQAETIAGQTGQIDTLGKIVTGEVHLVAISDLLTQHHSESVTNWTLLGQTAAHIDESLGALLAYTTQEKKT